MVPGRRGCLGDSAAVEHPRAHQGFQAGNAEALITGAGGENDGPRGKFGTVGELEDEVLAVRAKTGHLAQYGRFGAEGPGLVEGPVAQVGAADAEGEPEVG